MRSFRDFSGKARRTLERAVATLPLLAASMVVAPLEEAVAQGQTRVNSPNIYLVIMDDVGCDNVSYMGDPNSARTPNLDRLASTGVIFTNARTDPVCSPSRRCMMVGEHSFRTYGEYPNTILTALNYAGSNGFSLSGSRITIPEAISQVTSANYVPILLGKEHLTDIGVNPIANNYGLTHFREMGFEHHVGHMTNIGTSFNDTYDLSIQNVDGNLVEVNQYATTFIFNTAIVAKQAFANRPHLFWIAPNAAHEPFHVPPSNLHTYNISLQNPGTEAERMRAATEALDNEIGRFATFLDPQQDFLMVIGDNGTHRPAVLPPNDPRRAKLTNYEGGIHVPFFVIGPGIAPGGVCDSLVWSGDIFRTILDLVSNKEIDSTQFGRDSVSLLPYFSNPNAPSQREYVITERSPGNGLNPFIGPYETAIIREGSLYKLIERSNFGVTSHELYNIRADPRETSNLFINPPLTSNDQAEYDWLRAKLSEVRRP